MSLLPQSGHLGATLLWCFTPFHEYPQLRQKYLTFLPIIIIRNTITKKAMIIIGPIPSITASFGLKVVGCLIKTLIVMILQPNWEIISISVS